MELYNAQEMPLSNNPKLKAVQEKILHGESLTIGEKMIAGRDHPIKTLAGYQLKENCAYRAINEKMFQIYKEKGFIVGTGIDDEYLEYEENGQTFNNNKGINWYLGGVDLRYRNIVIECPADKKYFTPAMDNGNRMSFDPTIRHLKSSGASNPIPTSMITNVIDAREIKKTKTNKILMNF